MVSKPTVDPELDQIRQVLSGIFHDPGASRVEVFHTSGPYFRAIVVSDEFQGQDAGERQKRVWAFLRQSELDVDLMNRLFGVHPYTWREFREEFQET